MNEVFCGACGVRLGVTAAARLSGTVFCDEFCGVEPRISPNEERDDVIVELYRAGIDPFRIGIKMDLSRQRVSQILQTRGVS